MVIDRVYPLVPGKLPDGTVVWEERGKARVILDALRHYDPRLSLARNREDDQWEVWRANEDGTQGRVGAWSGAFLPPESVVLEHIASHDSRRGYDPIDALVARERARVAAEDAEVSAIAEASADRLHYELVDEFQAHAPAARPIFLGTRGKRTRIAAP